MMLNKPLWFGGALLLMLLMIALFGQWLPFVDADLTAEEFKVDKNNTIIMPPYPPSDQYLLGSDPSGRDMVSLLIIGAKRTFLFVFLIVVIRYLVAIPMAIMASKNSGFMYWLLSGWNQLFSGLPTIFAALFIINLPLVFESEYRAFFVIGILAFLEVGRVGYIFQQQASGLSRAPFVEAGRMVGNNTWGIYKRYYWPQLFPQIVINFVLDLGRVMLLLGQLGFFQIFISMTFIYSEGSYYVNNISLDWPSVLAQSRSFIRTDIFVAFWPAFAIALSVISFNLFGEGLRRYLESRSTSRYNPKLEREVMKQIKEKA